MRAKVAAGDHAWATRIASRLSGEVRDMPRDFLLNVIGRSSLLPSTGRVLLFRLCGLDIDLGASIQGGGYTRGTRLAIGKGSTVNYGCLFDCRGQVSIGERCGIGFRVPFTTTNHDVSDPGSRAGDGSLGGITVGNGVWIGSGATLLPGVTVGDGAVIGAGAVVTKDCKPHHLYAGVPAREIKPLPI